MNPIAKKIREYRQKHQLTQAQLAEALGVRYQTVSKWETGTTLPDTLTLPAVADLFQISVDDLFGRKSTTCAGDIPDDELRFLLQTYTQMYGPEAGPWNLSVENKYLEYRITEFFESHFTVGTHTNICNIGIGAGEWDRYLSYKLTGGTLTSIDREEMCCKQLQKRLLWEGNPNTVNVICADAIHLRLSGQFEIVTLVGSTVKESGVGLALLEQAMDFVKAGGSLYYQSLDAQEACNAVMETALGRGMKLEAISEDRTYGYRCRYCKFSKGDTGTGQARS